MRSAHFLHIGKTGGSAIKSALQMNKRTPLFDIMLHGHGVTLSDIPKGQLVFFFLRDPISRFVSGFYSRKRKGLPRYHFEWNPKEREVFEHFDTPGQLAVSLGNQSSSDHQLALSAMNHVQHLRRYAYWYISLDYFNSRLDDILYIGFQESLSDDFLRLREVLGVPSSSLLPSDDVGAHRNPQGLNTWIDEPGVAALKDWYAEDLKFVSFCRELMLRSAPQGGAAGAPR